MAVSEADLKTQQYVSDGDNSARQYHIMQLTNGVDQIGMASLATWIGIVGVLLNRPAAAGRTATVAYGGRGKVMLGGTISSAGAWLTTDGSGRAVLATSGQVVIGTALETGAAAEIVSVQLTKPVRLFGLPA